MNQRELIARLPDHLFWDVNRENLDPEKHAGFIISRVMDRGDHPEVDDVQAYYGDARIRHALLNAPHLEPRTIAFFSHRYHLDRKDFRAFKSPSASIAGVS